MLPVSEAAARGPGGTVGVAREASSGRGPETPLPEVGWALAQASPLATLAVDDQARTLLWSASAEELFGWRARDALRPRPPILTAGPGSKGSPPWRRATDVPCAGREGT